MGLDTRIPASVTTQKRVPFFDGKRLEKPCHRGIIHIKQPHPVVTIGLRLVYFSRARSDFERDGARFVVFVDPNYKLIERMCQAAFCRS